jgi:hypothetical protein
MLRLKTQRYTMDKRNKKSLMTNDSSLGAFVYILALRMLELHYRLAEAEFM